ncbi:SNF2 family N-terminal domain-containing protein [Suillus lakei]|nr:SNF2 family N-terminal domain-containing protein [Suillus lakei]
MVSWALSQPPALVIIPNSTIANWVREFARWAPKLRAVPSYGEAKARDVIGGPEPKYRAMATAYETLINPKDFNSAFKSIPRWEVIAVDEGRRSLFKKLNELNTIHRVILTLSWTPPNNNIREPFNLMHFLDPEELSDLEAELVWQLHTRPNPYCLWPIKRRFCSFPLRFNEAIFPLSMAPLQKEIYRSILSMCLSWLISCHTPTIVLLTQAATTKAGKLLVGKANLNDISMQLRKCLQHLYADSEDVEPRNLTPAEAHKRLLGAGTKLQFLKMLLPKLKARGHHIPLLNPVYLDDRVSQSVMAFDVIEDFIRGEGYKFLHLATTHARAECKYRF